jgi:CRISPR-associated endonuclease/helicase Cas3
MTSFKQLWAKTPADGDVSWHPLILHLLDVSVVADVVLMREPRQTRERMAGILGLPWEQARPWLLLVIACHDLGKACPGFQCKWEGATELLSKCGLQIPSGVDKNVSHAFVSQVVLAALLEATQWPEELAELAADAVGCHHGERASPTTLNDLEGNRRIMGDKDWAAARRDLFNALMEVLKPQTIPSKEKLTGPDFMLLSGLTSFADWIGSNEAWFPYGTPEDCDDLSAWWTRGRKCAKRSLDAIGWEPRSPLSPRTLPFEDVFHFVPRPLQQAVAKAVQDVSSPCILLVEAPMGEGKTEAAFYAHLELQRCFGHRGLYVALPTKATGNAMFGRTLEFLRCQGADHFLDLQLLHGATLLNDAFQNLRLSGIRDSETGGEIRAGEWFTHKKRALLSEYGVGTVDQALLTILPVRHQFVRLWGLANRVVVFDEIHAYDAYTGTLLTHLLHWLMAMGSSVVLLSATLPPSFRRNLARIVGAQLPEVEAEYPRLSIFAPALVEQSHFEADIARRQTICLQGIAPDLPAIYSELEKYPSGMCLAILNTVQRAQELYRLFPDGDLLEREGQRVGKRLSDGTEVFLFHARFPAERRQKREDEALAIFGLVDKEGKRNGRKILIATQVAEQSLDLDFDLIVTDLAPIDLVLQRAGRLWRHKRGPRPISEPCLLVAGLAGDEPPLFGNPLWWKSVYREDLLLRTWCLLHTRQQLTLPDEIDNLVQAVYEEQIETPESLQKRLEKAQEDADGVAAAHKVLAHQGIIGLPDDASWNDQARFVLYDDDEPGVHQSLKAKTRLGDDSVVAIPLFPDDGFTPDHKPDFDQAKRWFMRAVSVSRMGVVKKLRALGVPEGWRKSPLLRNCHAWVIDTGGRWVGDAAVRLDDDLGVVYEAKEAE